MQIGIERNILGDLRIYKGMNMKPNYSALQRKYGIDRHTIKKYYVNDGINYKERKQKVSKYDKYEQEILEIMKEPEVTIRALYQYLIDKYGDIGFTYSGLKSFTLRKGIKRKYRSIEAHVRFETKPGEQLQVDWKEDIEMTSTSGDVFKFNIFGATLGYSRQHEFIYSKTRTTEDFLRCTIDTFNRLGGLPNHIKTDNMAAVVSITNGMKKKHPIILQFEKDTGIKIKLCKVHSPETKGKVESSNRFLQWLLPYNHKFKDEAELIDIINRINIAVNKQTNQTTNIPPIVLFKKEKEYLNPMPSKILLESYISNVETQTVPPTLLVSYKGNGYSVPKSYIGKRVKLIPITNKLYIYFNTELITIHDISLNKFNYQQEHYVEALKSRIKDPNQDINEIAMDNLARLSKLGGTNE
ncbi:MAG: IS21 family transposase [Bacilli bacterium]